MDPKDSLDQALPGLALPAHIDWMGDMLRETPLERVTPQPLDLVRPRRTFHECADDAAFDRFIESRSRVPAHFLPFLTLDSVAQYRAEGARLFLSECGRGGYGIRGEELLSVFSLPGAKLGLEIAHDAVARGARQLDTLDVNGKVVGLYLRAGFQELRRLPWDAYHAPQNWNYDLWGRPDLVVMRYQESGR